MSFVFDLGDYYEENDTNHNLTPYIVNPKTLSCETQALGPTTAVVVCIIHISIFLLAVPGNVLVGWVLAANRKGRSPSDVYLLHLTVADGLLALALPFWAVDAIRGWIFGDFMCKFISLTIEANFYTSILFLACISIDRYLAIVRAAVTRKDRQQLCSRMVCASVWIVGWALALPALFNDAFKADGSNRTVCSERYDIGSATLWRRVTRGLRHILGFLIPLVIMLICYGITITRLLRTRGFQKHRAMRVIVVIVIAFLLCWTPYHLTVIIDTLMRADVMSFSCAGRYRVDMALHVTHSLALFHSCINPVLYAFVGAKFRKNLWLLFQKKIRHEKISVSRPSMSRSTSQTSDGHGALF